MPDWFIGFPAAPYLKQAVDLVELQPGECVCDAACGSGFNIARLVRAVGPAGCVIAAEDNPHLLGEAKKKARRRSWPNSVVWEAWTTPNSSRGDPSTGSW